MTANFYERLGVARSSSDEAIRSAYRALARKHHPDLHGHASPQIQEAKSLKMGEISEAYEV
ncbi:MAG: DnaJ domain-containing protein, partial [Actinomycetes bacterium]